MWKQKPLFPGGPSGQQGSLDEGCSQTSTCSSSSSSSCTICSWLTCFCTQAARPDGPDGHHYSGYGCGLLEHTLGHAITGAPVEVVMLSRQGLTSLTITYQEPQGTQQSLEIKQFLECARNQSDVKLCKGFNEVLRQCRTASGLI